VLAEEPLLAATLWFPFAIRHLLTPLATVLPPYALLWL